MWKTMLWTMMMWRLGRLMWRSPLWRMLLRRPQAIARWRRRAATHLQVARRQEDEDGGEVAKGAAELSGAEQGLTSRGVEARPGERAPPGAALHLSSPQLRRQRGEAGQGLLAPDGSLDGGGMKRPGEARKQGPSRPLRHPGRGGREDKRAPTPRLCQEVRHQVRAGAGEDVVGGGDKVEGVGVLDRRMLDREVLGERMRVAQRLGLALPSLLVSRHWRRSTAPTSPPTSGPPRLPGETLPGS